jgi:transposase-like protein
MQLSNHIFSASTRNVQKVVSCLGVNQVPASCVSKVYKELDEKVREFLETPIDIYIPFLFVDALSFTVRDGVRYDSKDLFVIAGVRMGGSREVFPFSIADSKHELTWKGSYPTSKKDSTKVISSYLMVITASKLLQER